MSEVLAMLLDWATKEGKDFRLFTFDFNKFFDRYDGLGVCSEVQDIMYTVAQDRVVRGVHWWCSMIMEWRWEGEVRAKACHVVGLRWSCMRGLAEEWDCPR